MVTLRSTSPQESEEARKKELEAREELEASNAHISAVPVPVPQSVGKSVHSLSLPTGAVYHPPLLSWCVCVRVRVLVCVCVCVCVRACVCPVADRMKPISVDSFRDHVNKMHIERDKGFEAEYQVLIPL